MDDLITAIVARLRRRAADADALGGKDDLTTGIVSAYRDSANIVMEMAAEDAARIRAEDRIDYQAKLLCGLDETLHEHASDCYGARP